MIYLNQQNNLLKFKKLYLKYLRAESFRKSLVYQKRFLIIMLSGYEETEREILATLKYDNMFISYNQKENYMPDSGCLTHGKNQSAYQKMGEVQSRNSKSIYSSRFRLFKPKSRFKTGVICIIAISRIKYVVVLINKWRKIDHLKTFYFFRFLVKKHSGLLGKLNWRAQFNFLKFFALFINAPSLICLNFFRFSLNNQIFISPHQFLL